MDTSHRHTECRKNSVESEIGHVECVFRLAGGGAGGGRGGGGGDETCEGKILSPVALAIPPSACAPTSARLLFFVYMYGYRVRTTPVLVTEIEKMRRQHLSHITCTIDINYLILKLLRNFLRENFIKKKRMCRGFLFIYGSILDNSPLLIRIYKC